MIVDESADDALLQHSAINRLPKPHKHYLEIVQDWLRRPECGNKFLQRFEDRPWNDNSEDLVALGNGLGDDIDSVTRWTATTVIPCLDRLGLHRFIVGSL